MSIILCGDFNGDTKDPVCHHLAGNGYKSSYGVMNRSEPGTYAQPCSICALVRLFSAHKVVLVLNELWNSMISDHISVGHEPSHACECRLR